MEEGLMDSRRLFIITIGCGLLVDVGTAWAAGGGGANRPQVATALSSNTSIPLRDMNFPRARPGTAREIPNKRLVDLLGRRESTAALPDPLRQSSAGTGATPTPILNFDGLSNEDNKATLGFRVVPPDTEGDVGREHYVQFINSIFAVYDKQTGQRVFGPAPGNLFWQGFGGICEQNNDGDPIVLYDHLADRWVVSQFAIGVDGHQCIAVSKTSDPIGEYHRYDFVVSPGAFNDYPKLGVWPDAYYMSANQFGFFFDGVIAVAFERDKMLAGDPNAQMVKFGPLPCDSECFFSLQPSHLEGRSPRPHTPNTFVMAFDDDTAGTGSNPDGYRLWDFSVDWKKPAKSSFTPLAQVDTSDFDDGLCGFTTQCIPQPPPGEPLDPLAGFTMYRAQYRRFARDASLVLNHTVDVTGRNLAGIRWVELRNEGDGWFLHQTGTFAPADGDHRWMGSIATDRFGNIALGYSVSGKSTFPSIRYVSRKADDPLGEMPGGEVELVAGTGSQMASFSRWGDYSTMSVDPDDDCTFWFTHEYYANTGSFDFKTRIGSFAFPECN